MIREIPADAIYDCTQPGVDASSSVEYWVERLNFSVDPDIARDYLRSYGAWDDSELTDDAQNVSRLFWIICGNLREDPSPEIYLGE